MSQEPTLQKLHVRLIKSSVRRIDAALEEVQSLSRYELKCGLGFDGRLYVSPPSQAPPRWLQFVQRGTEEELREITNRTNAAVLVIRQGRRLFAFTFGHGRHLLREDALEPDFGLKTALNALRHDSLRSIDSFAVEEQTVHTRSQATRASGIEVFGIDVMRDIVRAITGTPREGVPLQNVSGTTATLAISAPTDFRGLGPLADLLLSLYRKRVYKEHFSWVDNVQRVVDPAMLEPLNHKLLEDLRSPEPKAYLAPPQPVEWDAIDEFGYTRRRTPRDPDLTLASYLENIDEESLTIDTLKRHRAFVYSHGEERPSESWPVYKCLVFEAALRGRRFVLTAGEWFEVDRDFVSEVREILAQISGAKLQLPHVLRRATGKLEAEPDYNQRVARQDTTIALLDTKVARCRTTTTGIEVCDLLTKDRDLLHVKHKKGGSSSLSHLFAQARISAEALLRDAEFREDARRFLRQIKPAWERRIPREKPDPGSYRVVFVILGA